MVGYHSNHFNLAETDILFDHDVLISKMNRLMEEHLRTISGVL